MRKPVSRNIIDRPIEIISTGIKWRLKRGLIGDFIDWFINKSVTLSETWLWYPLGGFHECQYLIRKPE